MRVLYPYGEEFTGRRAREVHTINRAHSLAGQGVEVTLIAAESQQFHSAGGLLEHFDLTPNRNLSIAFLPRRFSFGPFGFVSTKIFYRALGRWLKKQDKFDLAYLIHLKAADFLQAAAPDLPVVFEAHEIFADSHPEQSAKHAALSEQESRVYRRARAVVSTSRYLLNTLRERYSLPEKARVIPNSVDERFFSVELGKQQPLHAIYVGSFQPWKGVEVALQAMRFLPEWTLRVYGGTPEQIDKLRSAAPQNVIFHGYAGLREILPALQNASVALIPNLLTPKSSLYTFPMKLLEYAAAGKIIVSSDLPVIRELKLGPWAIVLQSGDPRALANEIVHAAKFQELAPVAREWARKFTWPQAALELKPFLQSISEH